MNEIFILLVIFQLKHYLADYLWQTQYMLKKFSPGWDFVLPLLSHSLVHAYMTFGIALLFIAQTQGKVNVGFCIALGLFDLVIHFIMDRIKAGPKYLGRYKALSAKEYVEIKEWEAEQGNKGWSEYSKSYFDKLYKPKINGNKYFWLSLGLDQLCYHLTNYAIIWSLIRSVI